MEALPNAIPKIINRYVENFKYIVNQIQNIIDPEKGFFGADIKYGFSKLMIARTGSGSIVALDSKNGQIKWSQFLGQELEHIEIRKTKDLKQVIAVKNDEILLIDPLQGTVTMKY